MPTDHSVWPDNCQCIVDNGKQSAGTCQYQSVNGIEGKLLGTSPTQHIELLPQHHNLGLKRSTRPKKRSTIIPKNNLLHSDIEQQHRPILCQPATGSDLRQGHPPSRSPYLG